MSSKRSDAIRDALDELKGLSRIDSEKTRIRLIEQLGKAHDLNLLDEIMTRIMENEERRPANIFAVFLHHFRDVYAETRPREYNIPDTPIKHLPGDHPVMRMLKASCGRNNPDNGQPSRLFKPDYPAIAEAARDCATCKDLPEADRERYQRMVDAYDGTGPFDGQGSENIELMKQVRAEEQHASQP